MLKPGHFTVLNATRIIMPEGVRWQITYLQNPSTYK